MALSRKQIALIGAFVLILAGGSVVGAVSRNRNERETSVPMTIMPAATGTSEAATGTPSAFEFATSSPLKPLDPSFDWRRALQDTDWQKLLEETCSDDPGYVFREKCGSHYTRDNTAYDVVPATEDQKKLYDFIARVVSRAVPEGYTLGNDRGRRISNSTDVWLQDVNGDGSKDMLLFVMPIPKDAATNPYASYNSRDKSLDKLLVVTPLALDGTSRMLFEVSAQEFAAASYFPDMFSQIAGTTDFDHDGQKELLFVAGFMGGGDLREVFRVDYDKAVMSALPMILQGTTTHMFIGSHGVDLGAEIDHYFFRNIDGSGADEYITARVTGFISKKTKLVDIEVYAWDGSTFVYSQVLSEKLRRTFDPETGIPNCSNYIFQIC
jgi:hypothetical protein